MKKLELRRVPYGTVFQVFGDEFVALDYIDGGVLAIRRDVWKCSAFDDRGVNDLRGASITKELGEYLKKLIDGGASEDDILEMSIDLKAMDGTHEYDRYYTRIGLLTMEQYGKYQHIIPDVERAWWLATPRKTPGEKHSDAGDVQLVYSLGGWSYNHCRVAYGIRPDLILNASLLVSIETANEAPIFGEYMNYVQEWVSDKKDIGSSPMTYAAWKKEHIPEDA